MRPPMEQLVTSSLRHTWTREEMPEELMKNIFRCCYSRYISFSTVS